MAEEPSVYARFFDKSSPVWSLSPELNLAFLKCQENFANDKLRIQGILFLNEVYDMLGLPRTKAGQVVGWVALPDTVLTLISFNIPETGSDVFLLDFNVDGVVVDCLEGNYVVGHGCFDEE